MSNTIFEHKLITLNSRYANKINGTYNSNVLFYFKGILTEEDDIISSNICIMNAQIPVSFYTINETNNYFVINVSDIIIPTGNYNGNSLITALNTAMYAVLGFSTPTITLSPSTGKLTFTSTSGFPIDIIFPTNLLTGGINYTHRILGFNPSSSTVGLSIDAPYLLNLLGINRLAIRSNKLAISSYNSVSLNLGITLATIPVDVPSFSLINYTNQTDLNKSVLRVKVIDEIDISIVDEDNNLINMNNTEWTIALVLENIRVIPNKYTNSFETLIKNSQLETIENKELREEEKKETKDLEELELLGV
jgi:hypothetical protein